MSNSVAIGVAYQDQYLNGAVIENSSVTGLTALSLGTLAAPVAVTTADTKVTSFYGTSSATSGDTRLNYSKLTFTSTGSGETSRAFSVVTGANGATAGTINGSHVSLEIDGSGTISGAGNALRATLGGTSTNPKGTLAAIQADSNFASGGTWTNASFIRFTNSGTGTVSYLANVPTTGSGLIVAPHITQVMTDSIRIVMADGNVRYIMCTTSAANRTGGA
jgi:hypothetical protein